MPLRFGGRIDEAIGGSLGIAGLQHIKIFRPVEGQAVVEAAFHQIHKGAGREGGVVAVHHYLEGALVGAQLHPRPAEQPRQLVVVRRDGEGEGAYEQVFGGADVAQGRSPCREEAVAVLGFGGCREVLEVAFQTGQVGCGHLPLLRWEGRQDLLPIVGKERLAAPHGRRQGVPALGSQVVAGGLEPVLQILEIGLADGQGIAQEGFRIRDGISLGQVGPGRRGARRQQAEQHHQQASQQPPKNSGETMGPGAAVWPEGGSRHHAGPVAERTLAQPIEGLLELARPSPLTGR